MVEVGAPRLPDDASRGPGEGIRHMETPVAPADIREQPVLRLSAGTGALLGADGELLAVAARAAVEDQAEAEALESGEEPA